MKLSMFLKGQPGSENKCSKFKACVGRFITGTTKNRDEGKHYVFLSQCGIKVFYFHFYQTNPIFYQDSP